MKTNAYCIVMTAAIAVVFTSFGYAQGAAGIALEYDSAAVFTVTAGEVIGFDLRARNERQGIVENWDNIGKAVTLTVRGSWAETDTSTRSWNHRSRAYTWTYVKAGDTVLPLDSITFAGTEPLLYYTIPKEVFVMGRAALSYIQSRADTGIVLSLAPRWNFLQQDSPPLSFLPGPPENFLLEITSQTANPNEVYLLQRYEVVVTPRDRYLNTQPDSTVSVTFSARFPNEFDQLQPGLDDVFRGEVLIKGPTNYFLASRVRRADERDEERQWVEVYSTMDPSIIGRSDPYQILDHAPNPVSLLSPPDETLIKLGRSTNKVFFSWEKAEPGDPFTDIQISRFDPAKSSDLILYIIRFLNATNLVRAMEFVSDHGGWEPQFTAPHSLLNGAVEILSGFPFNKKLEIIWYVESTDGLYTTASRRPSEQLIGNRMTVDKSGYYDVPIAVEGLSLSPNITLHPNYPNPFNPVTTISVDLSVSSHCRLRVYNLIGEEVALLHDGFLEVGKHRFMFEGSGLPSGTYSYRLEADGATLTRNMVLLR
ncbi:MAG: hypothetical protein WBQ23_08785 [Bacteroidota bacterium]